MDGGTGPLAPFADGFRQELLGLDHPPESVKHYLVFMGQLDGWLMAEGREVVELTAAVAEEFLCSAIRPMCPSPATGGMPRT